MESPFFTEACWLVLLRNITTNGTVWIIACMNVGIEKSIFHAIYPCL